MKWDVDKVEIVAVEAVAAVPGAVAVVGRVAWGVPKRPGQAETACAPVTAKVPHQAGQPCYQMTCPKCGTRMTRD